MSIPDVSPPPQLKFGSPGKSLADLKDRVTLEKRVLDTIQIKRMQEEILAEEQQERDRRQRRSE